MVAPATPDDEARRKLIRNEQLKISASASNTLAIAFVVTGGVAPAVAYAYDISAPHGPFWSAFLLLWAILGTALHLIARYILKGLTP
jgi:hypothetical protein